MGIMFSLNSKLLYSLLLVSYFLNVLSFVVLTEHLDINIPIFFFMYAGYKCFKDTKVWKRMERDLVSVSPFFFFVKISCVNTPFVEHP